MSDRMNVTVDAARKVMTIQLGSGLGVCRMIEIDMTDITSVVNGILTAADLNDQYIQSKISAMSQRLEALERRGLSKSDAEYLADLVRGHPNAHRADGKPTPDDELAARLDAIARADPQAS